MSVMKRLTRAAGAALVLAAATISTSANAGWGSPFWGVGPENNGFGFGPAGTWGVNNPRWFGMGPQANYGIPTSILLGLNNQQSVGLPPFPSYFGIGYPPLPAFGTGFDPRFGMSPRANLAVMNPIFWGMSAQQDVGLPLAPPQFFGMNPQQNVGFPGPGPYSWGMNPQQSMGMFVLPPFLGVNPQENVGFAPPWIGVNPQQGSVQQQQAGAQPVQCTINGVPALTKSVDDCEKAGGDVAKGKTAAADKN
jgi:hypothetical protein